MKQIQAPLYRKIEDEFEQKYILPQIVNERAALSQIKETHQRVDLNEIRQHQLKHQEQLMLIQFQKSENRRRHKSMNPPSPIEYEQPRSQMMR